MSRSAMLRDSSRPSRLGYVACGMHGHSLSDRGTRCKGASRQAAVSRDESQRSCRVLARPASPSTAALGLTETHRRRKHTAGAGVSRRAQACAAVAGAAPCSLQCLCPQSCPAPPTWQSRRGCRQQPAAAARGGGGVVGGGGRGPGAANPRCWRALAPAAPAARRLAALPHACSRWHCSSSSSAAAAEAPVPPWLSKGVPIPSDYPTLQARSARHSAARAAPQHPSTRTPPPHALPPE